MTRVIAGIETGSDSPVFLVILAVHVPLRLLAVMAGLAAMLKNDLGGRSGRDE
ncbi:MAG: hypothetical protein ACREQR_15895 [Candidatus Binataceae bacterium]